MVKHNPGVVPFRYLELILVVRQGWSLNMCEVDKEDQDMDYREKEDQNLLFQLVTFQHFVSQWQHHQFRSR